MTRSEHPVLRETLWHARLAGGGEVWVLPRPGHRCHAVLRVGFGALHERPVDGDALPDGVAHFLEHRLFEKAAGDIAGRFSDLGADVDAQTGLTSTDYACTAGVDEILPAIDLLLELAGDGHFPEASVARERAIIGHEIELFEDSLEWVGFQAILAALYPGQRHAVDIAGTLESLAHIDAEVLRRGHRAGYRQDAVQLFVSGPLPPAAVGELAARRLDSWPTAPAPAPRPRPGVAQPDSGAVQLAVPRPRLLLAFIDEPRSGMGLLRRELALELALDALLGPASAFFARHYEDGLIDGESFGGEVHLDPCYGFCLVGGDTDDPAALRAALLDELDGPRAARTLEQGFERARRRAYGEMICRWEDVETCTTQLEAAAVHGCHPFDAVDLFAGPDAVDLGEAQQALDDCLRPSRFAEVIVGSPS